MCPSASRESFGTRWAHENLTREPSEAELRVLELFPECCDGDETRAARRARRYYAARGRAGISALWHHRRPDDEDILSSCQDAYIVPLRVRSVGGRRLTLVRLPAPTSLDRPLSIRALVARWLMILDIRVREEQEPSEEVVFVDVCDLQAAHYKHHFRGNYWRDFFYCLKMAYPKKFVEVHIVNTSRLKAMSLLLLRAGLRPWRRSAMYLHPRADSLNQLLGADYFPHEGLPLEYGGKAGPMKDLNDEWTKKLLSNAKWLQAEEKKFYETELKPQVKVCRERNRLILRSGRRGAYDVLNRTRSERSLLAINDLDECLYGSYRTLKITSDHGFYG